MLTKSEQRVVILVVVALLGAAFVRYWRKTNLQSVPNKIEKEHATATPFPSPEEEASNAETQE